MGLYSMAYGADADNDVIFTLRRLYMMGRWSIKSYVRPPPPAPCESPIVLVKGLTRSDEPF